MACSLCFLPEAQCPAQKVGGGVSLHEILVQDPWPRWLGLC